MEIDQAGLSGPGRPGLGQQLCFALYSAQLGFNRIYRSLLRERDLTYPQYLVLLVLWEQDGLNVSEICTRLYLETTTLTPLLKRMEARGLLQRRRSAQDERQVIVSLTQAGHALQAELALVPARVAEAVGCSMDDIAGLRNELATIRDRLFAAA
jgi:DNA-binding MarR family transcriptional regulator